MTPHQTHRQCACALTIIALLALPFLACMAVSPTSLAAADRPPIDLSEATPEQLLGHDKVLSAELPGDLNNSDTVALMPWRSKDDIVEGWDWSLPSVIEPVPNSGLIFRSGEKRSLPGNKLMDIAVYWRDVEPEEGKYDFGPLIEKLKNPPPGIIGYRFHFYATVGDRLNNRNGKRDGGVAPDWLRKYDIPLIDMTSMEGRFQLFNYPIWDQRYHERYLKVIKALGKSGIPEIPGLHIVYVGAISKSWGEELYIPRDVAEVCERDFGLAPGVFEKCLHERLDAWAEAFGGHEKKLAWVGAGGDCGLGPEYQNIGTRILDYAYSLGMGQRCGFVENYLYQLHNPQLGQLVDDGGYLTVDESCPAIADRRAFGDENEEYGEYWTGRFGPLATHRYRYHESMLRALQMRRNYLWMSSSSIDMDPQLTAWVSLELGRAVDDAPDAFCYLRESEVNSHNAGRPRGEILPIKNFERWLHQRDGEGSATTPAIKAAQHESMWMVPAGHKFDYIARRTDLATENDRITMTIDDRFLGPENGRCHIAVKVTYHDVGHGRWSLVYSNSPENLTTGLGKRTIQCENTGNVRTATFFLSDASFNSGDTPDLIIQAENEDAVISFVRVIKLD